MNEVQVRMERVMPRKIDEVPPVGTVRVVEVLPDGRRRLVEVLPSGAELGWVEDVAGGDDPPAEAA